MRRFVLLIVMFACAGVMVQAQGQQQQQTPPPPPKNLKVLPKDTPRPEVVRLMRTFTRALGVRCQHCHVGEGNDLSQFDFASDAKPTKEIARKMMTMVMDVNQKYLAGVGEPSAPAAEGQPALPKVTCFTCHRGATKPLNAPPPGEGRGGGGARLKW